MFLPFNFIFNSCGENRLVFQQVGTPRNPLQAGTTSAEDAEAREAQEEGNRRSREEMRSAVERATVSPETRQRLREFLASDSTERHALVERFLEEKLSEEGFEREYNQLEQEDRSWKSIFGIQREIRKKIEDLQWKAESYVELLPRKKEVFEGLLKNVKSLNREDAVSDRSLRRELSRLAAPNEQGQAAVLSPDDARIIYEADPLSDAFELTMKKYKERIERAPSGGVAWRRILTLKREEKRTMVKYGKLYDELNKIVEDNVSKVKLLADRDYLLKVASKSVGLKIKEGTEIEYTPADAEIISTNRKSARISRIEFDTITRRDSKGKPIDKVNGMPYIHLNDPMLGKMTLARFKKWVDATDATEALHSVGDVEKVLELTQYGIKIKKGMVLSYPRRHRQKDGSLEAEYKSVSITDIKDGKIFFDGSVEYPPGVGSMEEYEMRSWLNFSEFAKWWTRYEVEKAVSLVELRDLLMTYNKIENKTWGLELKDNPPIFVEPGEELRYPDEYGATFQIKSVDADKVVLENGRSFSLPEFFNWVRNNHVQRVPEKEKGSEEAKKKQESLEYMMKESEAAAKEVEFKEEFGAKRFHESRQYANEIAAGSLLGKLKELWFTTQFLSVKDLFNMAKELSEFVKRKHSVRSKTRYGIVGARLPWVLGTEFERVRQAASNEEVGKYKEAMEKWGVEKIRSYLHKTTTKDVAKACILTLVAKGDMRWDDPEFWHALNMLTARYTLKGAQLYIPEPDKLPQNVSGEDLIGPAIDELWGKNQFAEWFQENTSHYNSTKNNFEYKFKQLENDPKGTGGPGGECIRLLNDWKHGKHVNAQEYEAMIDGAIKYGKMGAENKMFFIIAGVLARQGEDVGRAHGETLLHMDRIGELNSKYTNNFPMLDFFTQVYVKDMSQIDPKTGQFGKPRKFNREDYYGMMKKYFPDDYKAGEPKKQFSRFMWEVMMMEEEVRTRITKGIRNAENMDHDDAQLFIPPTTASEIDNLTTGPTGQKKYFTNSGYANAYPGFSHYVTSLNNSISEELDPDKKKTKILALKDALYSFVRFDAILDNRLLREDGDRRARLDDRHFQRATVVDTGCKLIVHQAQMRNLVIEIAREYGENLSWLYGKKNGLDDRGKQDQKIYERRIEELKDRINELIMSDNGEKAMRVITRAEARCGPEMKNDTNEHALRGLPESKRPPPEELARLREGAIEFTARGGALGTGH